MFRVVSNSLSPSSYDKMNKLFKRLIPDRKIAATKGRTKLLTLT